MLFVSIKMTAANLIDSSLFAKESNTFLQMSQASTKINYINLDKLYQVGQTLSNLIRFIKLDKLYPTV